MTGARPATLRKDGSNQWMRRARTTPSASWPTPTASNPATTTISNGGATADPDAMLAVLRVLGAPVRRRGDVPSGAARTAASDVAPAAGAGAGRLGRPGAGGRCCACRPAMRRPRSRCRLDFESGETRYLARAGRRSARRRAGRRRGRRLRGAPAGAAVAAADRLAQADGRSGTASTAECTLSSRADRAYGPDKMMHTWGVFLPLYALRTARDWGIGDFTDLGNLIGWTQDRGGGIVGTLPLLAAYLDEPLEPSPVLAGQPPVLERAVRRSRARRRSSPPPQSVVSSAEFAAERDALRSRAAGRLQAHGRAEAAGAGGDGEGVLRRPGRPAGGVPALHGRATRAPRTTPASGRRARSVRESWWTWPERLRDGALEPGDYDEAARCAIIFTCSGWPTRR